MRKSRTVWVWFEDYGCGCVSPYRHLKSQLIGYCGTHGSGRRYAWRVEVDRKHPDLADAEGGEG